MLFTTATVKMYKLNGVVLTNTMLVEGCTSPQPMVGELLPGTHDLFVFEGDPLSQEFPGNPQAATVIRTALLNALYKEAEQCAPTEPFLIYRRKKIRLIATVRDYFTVANKPTSLTICKRFVETLFSHYERHLTAYLKQQDAEIPF